MKYSLIHICDLLTGSLTALSWQVFVPGNSNDAFRIFESMNDRGARLTPVDLLKSHLLSHVGADEEKLNDSWRSMLTQLDHRSQRLQRSQSIS